jgi:hypothetical protein
MIMTDNLSYAWRAIPLHQIMPTSRLLDDLEYAGYDTAGDILDAKAETLAADVYGVGLRRADLIRQKVFDYVKPFGSQGEPQWVLVHHTSAEHEIEEPTPSRADTLMTIAALLGVALLVYMLARMVL